MSQLTPTNQRQAAGRETLGNGSHNPKTRLCGMFPKGSLNTMVRRNVYKISKSIPHFIY